MLLQLLRQHLQLDNTEEGQRAVRELSQRLSQLKSELSQQLSPLQKSELLQQLSRLQKSASQLQKFFKWGFSLAPLSGGRNLPAHFPLKLPKAPAVKPEQPANPPAVPDRLKSGKEWVPEVVKPVRNNLLANRYHQGFALGCIPYSSRWQAGKVSLYRKDTARPRFSQGEPRLKAAPEITNTSDALRRAKRRWSASVFFAPPPNRT
jgi:hypothetical protein